jgi:hypothetical protein
MVRDVLRSLGTPLVQKQSNETATASTEKQG